MQPNNLFWQASLSEIQQGYQFAVESGRFFCLFCRHHTESGRIYPIGEELYDAETALKIHIRQKHVSPLQCLLEFDKRWTGLTELQTRLISMFSAGVSDQNIAGRLNAGSVSTIRNHRFLLREKQKQAKVFLAIVELMEQQSLQNKKSTEALPENAQLAETKKILDTYFPQGTDGPLSTFPSREKRRLIILKQISSRFSPDRVYNEKEVNSILSAIYEDYILLRRQLIDYGFLSRLRDGSEYWVTSTATDPGEESATGKEVESMDERRKELIREYKETPRPMGVFQIKNNTNGKLLLLKAMDIPGIINRHHLELKRGMHRNHELQADWNRYGEAAFSFDILAKLTPEDYLPEQWAGTVTELWKEWLEKLQPFENTGYNKRK